MSNSTYSGEISREHPTAIVFLLDQSGSMSDPFGIAESGQTAKSKADKVADAANKLIGDLVGRCIKDTSGKPRRYYYIAVIGYGSGVASAIPSLPLALTPIDELAQATIRVEEREKLVDDGTGDLVTRKAKFLVWIDAVASGGTPMCSAMAKVKELLEPWLAKNPAAFPPVVINITDGDATDGGIASPAQELMQLGTDDGAVLLFNLHISGQPGAAVLFPKGEGTLPQDQFAKDLFNASSELPEFMVQTAVKQGYKTEAGARGYGFNADFADVVRFLKIGTTPRNLR